MSSPILSAGSALPDWLSYLETLHPSAIDMGQARIREVAQRLGVRIDGVVITVGGTHGKGSTCAMLEAVPQAGGRQAGPYASPPRGRDSARMRRDGERAW